MFMPSDSAELGVHGTDRSAFCFLCLQHIINTTPAFGVHEVGSSAVGFICLERPIPFKISWQNCRNCEIPNSNCRSSEVGFSACTPISIGIGVFIASPAMSV